MDNERKAPDVPFIVYESEQARAERNIKRMQICRRRAKREDAERNTGDI